jgi:hypothetical protein
MIETKGSTRKKCSCVILKIDITWAFGSFSLLFLLGLLDHWVLLGLLERFCHHVSTAFFIPIRSPIGYY